MNAPVNPQAGQIASGDIADASAEDRLAFAIAEVARRFPERTAIAAAAGGAVRSIDYATLAAAIARLETALDAARPVGVVARARRVETLVVIAAACGRQHVPVAFLADDSRDLVGELRDWVAIDDTLSLPADLGPPAHEFAVVPAQVVVATSGTSGPPKLVEHSWDSLLAAARLAEQWHGLGWILVYDATRWAGMQVWLQALLTGGRVIVPASRDPDTVLRAIIDEQAAVLPSTPTLLRRMISAGDKQLLSQTRIERITLGGEAADSQLLEQAAVVFRSAKITQVYATTELGEVFRVSDGRPGFPASWLGRTLPGGVRLATRRDGELLVQLSRDSAEVATGDVVERRGDRWEFTGRRSDVIVVDGQKVYPRRIEEILRSIDGVADARVYGMPSAISGELVAAEVVIAEPLPPQRTPEAIRAAALAACRGAVEPHGVPRILDFVKKIATNAAGKIPRRPM